MMINIICAMTVYKEVDCHCVILYCTLNVEFWKEGAVIDSGGVRGIGVGVGTK